MDLLKNIFKGDKVIWIIFLLLCCISIIEVFSAGSRLTYDSSDHWGPFTQHVILLTFGAGIVVIMHNIPYKWFQVFPYPLLLVSVILLLFVMITGFVSGDRINGAARWMSIMGIQFQPSELAKMGVVMGTAVILSHGQDENGASPKAFKRILIMTVIVCALIIPENYSTGVLLALTVYLMMFIGRIKTRYLLMLGGGVMAFGALCIALVMSTPDKTLEKIPLGHRLTTVKSRIIEFTNTQEVPPAKFNIKDKNAQVAHARIAVATSNVLGKGPGNSVQRDFLSHAYSDFIYAIIIEELGLAGGILVVFLYLCLLIRIGKIARKCDRTFPAFLIIGIGILLVSQALFNMMVAVGLAPVTGQPLPLISKGGTSIFINCAYIGIILSVSRYTARLDEQRRRDAMIPMQVEVGAAPEQAEPTEAQTAPDPTSPILNNDSEFK